MMAENSEEKSRLELTQVHRLTTHIWDCRHGEWASPDSGYNIQVNELTKQDVDDLDQHSLLLILLIVVDSQGKTKDTACSPEYQSHRQMTFQPYYSLILSWTLWTALWNTEQGFNKKTKNQETLTFKVQLTVQKCKHLKKMTCLLQKLPNPLQFPPIRATCKRPKNKKKSPKCSHNSKRTWMYSKRTKTKQLNDIRKTT